MSFSSELRDIFIDSQLYYLMLCLLNYLNTSVWVTYSFSCNRAITLTYRMSANCLTCFLFSFHSATFDRIAEINFNLDADDNSVSVLRESVSLCELKNV